MVKKVHSRYTQLCQKISWQRPFESSGWSCRSAPTAPFHFFKLPTELRLDILRYLLISEDPNGYVTTSALRALRHASSQLAREAKDVYWSENIFKFHQYDAGPDLEHCYFSRWLHRTSKDCVSKVRQISIRSPTIVTIFGPFRGHDSASVSSTIVYNLDLRAINIGQTVSIGYSTSHRGLLRYYPYIASYLDLSRVAQALFMGSGQVCITKRALMAFYIALSMRRSSAVFADVIHEGEAVHRSRVISTLVSSSTTIGDYEDVW